MNKILFSKVFFTLCIAANLLAQQKSITTWDGLEISKLFNNCLELAWTDNQSNATNYAFSHDGNLVAIGYSNGSILLYDLKNINSVTCKAEFKGHEKAITSLCFSQDGNYLVSGSEDCQVIFWHLRYYAYGQEITYVSHNKHNLAIKHVHISANSKYALAITTNGKLLFFDYDNPDDLINANFKVHVKSWDLNFAQFSPDNKYVLLGFLNNVGVYQIKSFLYTFSPDYKDEMAKKTNKHNITLNHRNVVSADITVDGSRILTGSTNGNVLFWDVTDFQFDTQVDQIGCREIDKNTTYTPNKSVALSVDGRYILTADNKVLLWDLWSFLSGDIERSKELKAINISADKNKGPVAFSRDGRYALTRAADWDKSHIVRVWYSQKESFKNKPVQISESINDTNAEFVPPCPKCKTTNNVGYFGYCANEQGVRGGECHKCHKRFYHCNWCKNYLERYGEIPHNCRAKK